MVVSEMNHNPNKSPENQEFSLCPESFLNKRKVHHLGMKQSRESSEDGIQSVETENGVKEVISMLCTDNSLQLSPMGSHPPPPVALANQGEEPEETISPPRRAVPMSFTSARARCILLYLFVRVLLTEVICQCGRKFGKVVFHLVTLLSIAQSAPVHSLGSCTAIVTTRTYPFESIISALALYFLMFLKTFHNYSP